MDLGWTEGFPEDPEEKENLESILINEFYVTGLELLLTELKVAIVKKLCIHFDIKATGKKVDLVKLLVLKFQDHILDEESEKTDSNGESSQENNEETKNNKKSNNETKIEDELCCQFSNMLGTFLFFFL